MKTTTTRRLLVATALLVSSLGLAAPRIAATHATVKVRPTAAAPAHTPVELVAARNEFVSFQVVVSADAAPATGVSASFPGLSGPGAIPQANVTLYREDYLNLTKPSFADAPTGQWPDALIPDVDETVGEKRNAFPFDVPQGQNRVIWVDVLVPKDAAAGAYTGTLTVTGSGFQEQLPIKLAVLNTELPSTSSLDTAFLFSRNMMCNTHVGSIDCGDAQRSYELTSQYMKLGLEHRITLTNTISHTGGDWATFDGRYAPWFDGTLATRLPGAKMTTIQYPWGGRTAETFAAFAEHFKSKGWLPRAFDYTGDEPPYGISFSEALSKAQAVKAAAPELRTLLTTTIQATDQNGLTPVLDLIVPVVNHMDGLEAPYVGDQRPLYDAWLQDPKKDLWIYQSCMSHGCAFGTNAPENKPGSGWPSYMVDASAARNRAMQWVVFLERAAGELYYETALALDTAWTDVLRFNGNGDGTLFYPGLPSRIGGTTHIGVPSIRLKQIRQGMQDYEWLKRVADAGDAAFATKIARTLIPSASSVGDDGAAFDLARRQLISRWLELQPSGAPPDGPVVTPEEPAQPPEQPPTSNPAPEEPTPPPAPGTPDPVNTEVPGAGGKVTGGTGCTAAGPGMAGIFGLFGLGVLARRRRSPPGGRPPGP